MEMVVAILILNYLIGCIVLSYVDDKEQLLFHWAKSDPFLYPLTVELWILVAIYWYKRVK